MLWKYENTFQNDKMDLQENSNGNDLVPSKLQILIICEIQMAIHLKLFAAIIC